MATSWIILLIPYFVPIAILAVLHVMDRRRGFARAVSARRQRPLESTDTMGRRQIA
jgi:hypothetical protein